MLVSNSLMVLFGKGSLQRIFRKISVNFPQTFRTLSWRNKPCFCKCPPILRRISTKLSAQKQVANDPISLVAHPGEFNVNLFLAINSQLTAD